jgi:tetratricopeptide (TPR) repeat protein
MRKGCFVILISFLAGINSINADSYLNQMFRESNLFYDQGQYQKAIEGYEKIISMGVRNKDVYFNIGNAYLKDNQLGRSILNYERSLKIERSNEEARENLNMALERIKDKQPFVKRSLFELPFIFIEEHVSIAQSVVFSTVCFWLLMFSLVFLMISRYRKKLFLRLSVILVVLLFIGLFALVSVYFVAGKSPGAIVMVSETSVLSGPGEQYTVGFKLHEGTKVFIDAKIYNWYKVRLSNKMTGWIKEETVEKI